MRKRIRECSCTIGVTFPGNVHVHILNNTRQWNHTVMPTSIKHFLNYNYPCDKHVERLGRIIFKKAYAYTVNYVLCACVLGLVDL